MNANASHIFFSPDDWLAILLRLGLAAIAGGVVGLNRDRIRRPAGLRTYMTVSVGSALFVMLTLQAGVDFNATNALSRTVQGITTGVGFIGAGLIFHQGHENASSRQVKGLTSAAALWLTASLGLNPQIQACNGLSSARSHLPNVSQSGENDQGPGSAWMTLILALPVVCGDQKARLALFRQPEDPTADYWQRIAAARPRLSAPRSNDRHSAEQRKS